MRKLILAGLLAGSACVDANDDIQYSFFEVGYGYLDINSYVHADGFYLDGAFELTDRFYLSAYVDDRDLAGLDFNRYGIGLGFHTNGTGNTDFYTELKVGKHDVHTSSNNAIGLIAGTRTAFNERFELITRVGYTHLDKFDSEYFDFELKGLFKVTDKSAFTLGLESQDGEPGAELGWRFSF